MVQSVYSILRHVINRCFVESLNLCHNDSIGLAGKSMPLLVYVFLVIVTRYFSRSGCTLQPRCLSEEFTQSMKDCYFICVSKFIFRTAQE